MKKIDFLMTKCKKIISSEKLNTAFIHCWIMPWWALNVLKNLIAEEYKTNLKVNVKIFTIFSDRKNLKFLDEVKNPQSDDKTQNLELNIVTALPSRINSLFLRCDQKNIPLLSSIFDYRNLILFYPMLMRILSKKIAKHHPQNIIISSFAVAKNITYAKANSKFNIQNLKLYLHSPMQYIRSHREEYLQRISGYKKWLFKKIISKLQKRDQQFTQYDKVWANSKYTAKLAKKIYGIDAEVKYPQVPKRFLDRQPSKEIANYYLYVGRLTTLVKELDLIIKLFNETKQPLLIMGTGPDEHRLKDMAKWSIIFLGRIDDEKEMIKIIQQSKGLINLTKESFGNSKKNSIHFKWRPGIGKKLLKKPMKFIVLNLLINRNL